MVMTPSTYSCGVILSATNLSVSTMGGGDHTLWTPKESDSIKAIFTKT